ncbi:LTXXQ domain protein, partial [Pseudomonas aeruginosa]|nr:LTXXQ domain protein [Pseudomonas aeruginosa]
CDRRQRQMCIRDRKKFDELQKKREQRKAEWAEFQQWKADKKSN